MFLLRWLVRLYKGPRILMIGKVATKTVHASQTILAGDCFADIFLRGMLANVVDELLVELPSAHFGVMFDDLQCLVEGRPASVLVWPLAFPDRSCRNSRLIASFRAPHLSSPSSRAHPRFRQQSPPQRRGLFRQRGLRRETWVSTTLAEGRQNGKS